MLQKKAAAARRDASQATTAAEWAAQLLDDPAYKEVRTRLRSLAKSAAKVRGQLLADAEAVTTEGVSNTFAGIGESASAAVELCKKTWKRGIDSKLKGRADLAAKLPQILPTMGEALHSNVAKLQGESTRLPTSAGDTDRVRGLLAQFDELMGQLQLDGAVGTFLQTVASDTGASLDLLQKPEVQKFLTDHELWKGFRVRLP